MTRKFKLLAALLLALAMFAAACGSDAEDAADDAEEAAEEVADEAEEAVEEVADEAEEAVEEVADEAEEAVEDATEDEEATADGSDTTVGLTFDLLGRGDQSFNDSAAAGIDRAIADYGVSVNEVTPTDASARTADLQTQAGSADLVIGVGFSFAEGVAEVAPANPDTFFAIVDDSLINFETGEPIAENAAGLVFSEEQGSYLVGVAAALKTETDKVGFIGGVSGIGLIEKFEAGFTAGVQSVNPDVEVVVNYITEFPDFAGFESPDRAQEIASAMYDEGADIIYSAAGLSGSGTFVAAREYTEAEGTKVWGIGVDSDQYNTVDPQDQDYVLTSMLKRVDVAVYDITQAVVEGTFEAGERRYDLSVDGVGYSTSGGFVDDITTELEAAKAAIISGEVEVPAAP